jgi:hypothetical protein
MIVAIALAAMSIGSALADDGPMATRFGNTIVLTKPDGSTEKYYFRADHTFTMKMEDASSDGTWSYAGGKVCRVYKTPPAGKTNPDCVTAGVQKIGDTWTAKAGTVSLLKGIQ